MITRKIVAVAVVFVGMVGCAQFCQFGKDTQREGLLCHSVFAKAKEGMKTSEVETVIGKPQRRSTDAIYRDVRYDEVWIYETDPETILYFKNGVLEIKEYR